MKNQNKILISFIGTNDAGKLLDLSDGAILTGLKNEKFEQVHLLWNKGSLQKISYEKIADYLKSEIIKRKLAKKVSTHEFAIKDVTDHNQIYLQLKEFTDTLPKNKSFSYTAAISSGTPAMQVCWILLAESGDFSETIPLRLIKIKDPKFGKSENILVKIDTSLPRIVRLKEEVESLKKDLIPKARITVSKPRLRIGDSDIILSPMELTYYKYFAERILSGEGFQKFSGVITSKSFLERIIEIHEELFPDLDSNRVELNKINKKSEGLYIYSFRANVSKTNRQIKKVIEKESVLTTFQISIEGQRGAKFYGIKAPRDKIKIIK